MQQKEEGKEGAGAGKEKKKQAKDASRDGRKGGGPFPK
jgi:hypothetical protein